MNDALFDFSDITPKKVREWKQSRAKLLRTIAAVDKLIEAAEILIGPIDEQEPEPEQAAPTTKVAFEFTPPKVARVKGIITPRAGQPTWTDAILQILSRQNRGMTHEEVKAEIRKGPLKARIKASDKGFYGAVGKLAESRQIIKHNGRLFAREAHVQFMIDVANGLIKDEPPAPAHQTSAAKGAIIAYLVQRGPEGATSVPIFNELEKDPEIAKAFARGRNGKTAVYNLLARMVARGELEKSGGAFVLPEAMRGTTGDQMRSMGIIPQHARLVGEDGNLFGPAPKPPHGSL